MIITNNKRSQSLEKTFLYIVLFFTLIKLILTFSSIETSRAWNGFLNGIFTGIFIMSVIVLPKSYMNLFKKYWLFILIALVLVAVRTYYVYVNMGL